MYRITTKFTFCDIITRSVLTWCLMAHHCVRWALEWTSCWLVNARLYSFWTQKFFVLLYWNICTENMIYGLFKWSQKWTVRWHERFKIRRSREILSVRLYEKWPFTFWTVHLAPSEHDIMTLFLYLCSPVDTTIFTIRPIETIFFFVNCIPEKWIPKINHSEFFVKNKRKLPTKSSPLKKQS